MCVCLCVNITASFYPKNWNLLSFKYWMNLILHRCWMTRAQKGMETAPQPLCIYSVHLKTVNKRMFHHCWGGPQDFMVLIISLIQFQTVNKRMFFNHISGTKTLMTLKYCIQHQTLEKNMSQNPVSKIPQNVVNSGEKDVDCYCNIILYILPIVAQVELALLEWLLFWTMWTRLF